jgi:glycosyltransferase involved in cell wall biosynthesis
MSSEKPLVTVVTPTLDAERFLEDCVLSVLGQDYPNIEYLVVDSGSTDPTREILKKYEGRLRTITAPRQGPAAAIHVGLSQARGSILAWLNADDKYEPGAVRSAVSAFAAEPQTEIVYGDAAWIDERGAEIGTYPTIPFNATALAYDCFIGQPAAFFRVSAYRECPLDSSLSLSFDYDLWIRLAARGRCFQYVPQRLAFSRMHRESLTFRCRPQVFEVTMNLLKKHYGYVPLPWILSYLSFRRDGRDQFFEPLRGSYSVFAASLPFGIGLNRGRSLRFIGDWTSTAYEAILRRVSPLLFPPSQNVGKRQSAMTFWRA